MTGLSNEGKPSSYITDKLNQQFKTTLTTNQVAKKIGHLRKRALFIAASPLPRPRPCLAPPSFLTSEHSTFNPYFIYLIKFIVGILGNVSPQGASESGKAEAPQPDYAALGLLGEDDEMDVEEKQDATVKDASAPNAATANATDIHVTPGIVTPYRVRRLTKHLDLLWKHTAGETYTFKPVKVPFLDTFPL